jgi:hypothetical protein
MIVPGSVPTDCPAYHRSYPAGSKRKENATVKSGVLWRSFDFAEALRATNQYGTGKIPTKLPGNSFWTTGIDSSKTWKSRPILQPGGQGAGSPPRDLKRPLPVRSDLVREALS